MRASIAILDRCGFHPSQAIELTGKSGGPIETEDLIPAEKLSIVCRQLILAELEGFTISLELEQKLLNEIPPLSSTTPLPSRR